MAYRQSRVTGGAYSAQMDYLPIRTVNMYRGRAIGGPLHGVMLESPLTWDGRIKIPGNNYKTHPGHYKWTFNTGCWLWIED